MLTSDFDYSLPKELIAQEPVWPRDHSRLMILNKTSGQISHDYFFNLPLYLNPGDVLVFNDSKVIPGRLKGKKVTGGQQEILLLRPKEEKIELWPAQWLVIGSPSLKKEEIIYFDNGLEFKIQETINGQALGTFNKSGPSLKNDILKIGEMPLPPYVKHPTPRSFENYQTIYAQKDGSAAAPTAGFHFTPELIDKIKEKGVDLVFVTLHIGLGTFQPVKTEKIEEHQMHKEYFELTPEVAEKLNQAKQEKRRIIAVGTTVCRLLEHCALPEQKLTPQTGWTDLFIYPGYRFKFIDALITNFHLPKSTLLMLVCAFAGKDLIFKAYQEAIKNQYRFYSFGDAMFIY